MSGRLAPRYRPIVLCVAAILLAPTLAFAQSPWERAASNLALTFTGPLARSLALVAIVIGGLCSCSVKQAPNDRSRASSSAADLRCSRRNS
jgi:type IV secretory pathway VirB2 component (pilin)